MDLAKYDGKQFALLLCGETDAGEKDWAVFPGVARLRDGALYLERSGALPDVEILPEWYERILSTNDRVKKLLRGASYFIKLAVGNKPEAADNGYVPIGLKWPE